MDVLNLESVVSAVVLVGVRVSGLMLFAPVFGSEGLPVQLKAALTVAVTALLYPVCPLAHLSPAGFGWVSLIGQELGVGLLLGLAVQLVVEAAQMAGHFVGVQAGYSLVTVLDPQTQADTPVMATLHQLLALLIFLQLNVHHWLLRGLAASFAYCPAGSLFTQRKAAAVLLQQAGGIWLVGLQIAAPAVVATVLVDLTLGFLAKASPQLPVLFLGLPIKGALSLTLLAGSLMLWPGILEPRFAAGVALGERLLHLAR